MYCLRGKTHTHTQAEERDITKQEKETCTHSMKH